jgi:hypothetical protein
MWNMIDVKQITDGRIRSIVTRTLDDHFRSTYTHLNLEKYSEYLVRETVLECIKQMAFPVDMENPFHKTFVEKQWDHLAKRFNLQEHGN